MGPQEKAQTTGHPLFAQVDGASLAVFRILFGIIMVWEAVRYLRKDWIPRYFITPEFHFKYHGFEWVHPLPGDGMYWVFGAIGALGFCIAIGLFYRLAAILFAIGFAYIFLIDQTTYLNHFYLVLLFSILLIFMPANRLWSVDAWLRPALRSETVPAWSVWTLRAQMEVMLLYAGIVKINADWLALQPLEMWLHASTDGTAFRPLFEHEWAVAAAAYGSIALHVIGAPLLLWRRTRFWVFLAYCGFHLSNHFLFQIGIFPWFAIAGTLLFFDPDWPRQVAGRLAPAASRVGRWAAAAPRSVTMPLLPSFRREATVALIALWIVVQVLVPLRHLLYPGNPSWTEEGHRFAWQMKLRDKDGFAEFTVHDPKTGRSWPVQSLNFLTPRQVRKMTGRPDMLLQFAHHLADEWRAGYGVADPVVRARVSISLNGRREQLLIDPKRNLAAVKRSILPDDWVLPLRTPLRERPTFLAGTSVKGPEL